MLFQRTSNASAEPLIAVESILTHREMQILGLSAEGLTSKEIGARIFLSTNTVETYRKSMLRKTGSDNVVQLVAKAIRSGWIR